MILAIRERKDPKDRKRLERLYLRMKKAQLAADRAQDVAERL